ncbi:MAG: hypothetical protein LBK63_06875 [Treponema sp.]|jgi:hypothetical protein|nr:hypothetical protein [Treponema sp.]
MIKTCGEIVNAALDLSQLDGSNMLSYARIIYLLNSAYGRLYDYITRQTDDWGSKRVVVRHSVEIPRNLFKVRSVCHWDGSKEGSELESVDHEPGHGQYWLHGEELVCGGHPEETFMLRYYPRPVTLTYPCKPEETEYDKIYDNYIAAVEENAIRVVNLRNGDELFYPVEGTLTDFVLVRGVPAYLNDANELHDGTEIIPDVAELFQDKWGLYAYGYVLGDGTKHGVGWDGFHFDCFLPWYHDLWGAKYRYENGAILRAFYEEPNEWEDITNTFINTDKDTIANALFSSPYMMLELESKATKETTAMVFSNDSQYRLLPMIRQGNTPTIKLIDFDHNDENGYGVIYTVRGQKEIAGFVPDTSLDYPKTIYFDWLEAELAKLFMIEARQDVSVIDALTAQYWKRIEEGSERQMNYAYRLKDRRGAALKGRY